MRSKERLEKTMMIPSRSMESMESLESLERNSHYELISKCEGSRGTLAAQIWVQDLSILIHPNKMKKIRRKTETSTSFNGKSTKYPAKNKIPANYKHSVWPKALQKGTPNRAEQRPSTGTAIHT